MYEIGIKVKILMDILAIKQRALTQVLNITENQESILLSGETGDELHVFFNGMSHEKQILIDEVLNADTVFQNTFDELSDDFEAYADENKEMVEQLQAAVKQVMDLDIKIRVQEQRNRELITKHRKGKKIAIPKASKGYILKQYKKNSINTEE